MSEIIKNEWPITPDDLYMQARRSEKYIEKLINNRDIQHDFDTDFQTWFLNDNEDYLLRKF